MRTFISISILLTLTLTFPHATVPENIGHFFAFILAIGTILCFIQDIVEIKVNYESYTTGNIHSRTNCYVLYGKFSRRVNSFVFTKSFILASMDNYYVL